MQNVNHPGVVVDADDFVAGVIDPTAKEDAAPACTPHAVIALHEREVVEACGVNLKDAHALDSNRDRDAIRVAVRKGLTEQGRGILLVGDDVIADKREGIALLNVDRAFLAGLAGEYKFSHGTTDVSECHGLVPPPAIAASFNELNEVLTDDAAQALEAGNAVLRHRAIRQPLFHRGRLAVPHRGGFLQRQQRGVFRFRFHAYPFQLGAYRRLPRDKLSQVTPSVKHKDRLVTTPKNRGLIYSKDL